MCLGVYIYILKLIICVYVYNLFRIRKLKFIFSYTHILCGFFRVLSICDLSLSWNNPPPKTQSSYCNKNICCNKFLKVLYCNKNYVAINYSNNIFCCNKVFLIIIKAFYCNKIYCNEIFFAIVYCHKLYCNRGLLQQYEAYCNKKFHCNKIFVAIHLLQ